MRVQFRPDVLNLCGLCLQIGKSYALRLVLAGERRGADGWSLDAAQAPATVAGRSTRYKRRQRVLGGLVPGSGVFNARSCRFCFVARWPLRAVRDALRGSSAFGSGCACSFLTVPALSLESEHGWVTIAGGIIRRHWSRPSGVGSMAARLCPGPTWSTAERGPGPREGCNSKLTRERNADNSSPIVSGA